MITKRDKTKTLLVVGLLLAVAGLTLGFAAFSNTLTIKSSATVTPDASTFSVQFSASETEILVGEENPIVPKGGAITAGNAQAINAIIDRINPTVISNLNVSFLRDGFVVYNFYVHNTGEYDAYLNEIVFHNVDGKDSNIVCTAIENEENPEQVANQELVDLACQDISYQVQVSNENSQSTEILKETAKISGHILGRGQVGAVKVVITYTETNLADGPFDVSLGDIELVYSTVDVNATTTE